MAHSEFTSMQSSLVRLFTDGTMAGMSESQLLERFLARGDEFAFEAIVRRHGPMVLAVCRRILSDPNDVDDAFQATFLVLVKKGSSIRNYGVLGPWLHGVARRVAIRGRKNSRRRQARERASPSLTTLVDHRAPDEGSEELRAILDAEVTQLPETYRSALILCDLEGQTHEQVAAQLSCPVGTVKSRLARARDKLRSRLARRGIVSSAAILASTLAPEPASAVTTQLLESTLSSSARFVAGRELATGAVSAAVSSLVHGTIRSMSMSALKFATAIVIAAGVIASGAGVLAYQAPKSAPQNPAAVVVEKADITKKGVTEDPKVYLPNKTAGRREAGQGPFPNSSSEIAALAQARYSSALESLAFSQKAYRSNPGLTMSWQQLQLWALRALQAQLDLSDTKANQIDALEKYLKVLKDAENAVKPEDRDQLAVAGYSVLEAELWLAQARAGKKPSIPGKGHGERPGTGKSVRPGTDPKSQALLARLEESIPMKFANPTPLEEVLKYIKTATAGPDGQGIPIYIDPVDFSGSEENINMHEKIMQTPITMDLEGVPLRRVLKLIAEQLQMGYGIADGMVTMRPPNLLRRNWQELMVMEESFPESSPLALEVDRARRGELTTAELEQLSERLQAIEAVTKRYTSIRMVSPTGMRPGVQAKPANPNEPAR